jgi:hypothetical protein
LKSGLSLIYRTTERQAAFFESRLCVRAAIILNRLRSSILTRAAALSTIVREDESAFVFKTENAAFNASSRASWTRVHAKFKQLIRVDRYRSQDMKELMKDSGVVSGINEALIRIKKAATRLSSAADVGGDGGGCALFARENSSFLPY